MEIIKQLEKDLVEAMKAKRETELSVLRMLKTALKNKAIELKKDLTADEALAVLKSEAKKRRDSIEAFKDGGREDLAEKETSELVILEKYLPEQMSEDQVREEAKKIIDELTEEQKNNFGAVMGQVMAKLKGKADGGLVGKIVKELVS